jgi:hypothetical protein
MFQHEEFGNRAKYAGYDPVDVQNHWTEGYVPMHGADCHGHGTAVASLVGGKTYGRAKKANLYSVRVLDCNTNAPWYRVLDGLRYVFDTFSGRGGNTVIVLPLSGIKSNAINEMIKSFYDKNVVVITAAGNDGTDACTKSPASSPFAITVGSTDRHNNRASSSNYGSCVDLFAPGVGILAASSQCDSCTDIMSGTTLSAALTAGVVAAHLSQTPNLTPSLIKERLSYQSIPGVINFASIPEHVRSETPNLLLNGECGGTIVVPANPQIVLESPNFPRDYHPKMNCKWRLVAEKDCDDVVINFTHIVLEKNYDTLTVCLRDVCSEEELLVLTGDYGTPDCELQSFGRYMSIHMVTDGFTEAPGFRATMIAVVANMGMKPPKDKCSIHPSSVNSSIQLDVFSAGYGAGNHFSIKKDWNEIYTGRLTGINLVVIDEVNGSVIATATYNTHYYVDSDYYLASFIDGIPIGKIVCAAIYYDGKTRLRNNGERALMSLGSNKIFQLRFRILWALIGIKGAPRGHVIEEMGNTETSPVHITGRIHLKPFTQQRIEIVAESGGIVTINNTVVGAPYIGYYHDMNVVIVNETTGEIVDSELLDTSAETGAYSVSAHFSELVNCQPEGRIVVVAVKEEGVDHLSEEAKQACESIGSAFIRQVHHEGAWAIVGRKGAASGTVPESASNGAPAKSMYILTPSVADDILCQINVQSSNNYGIGSNISVNGVTMTHSTSTKKGSLVALLRDGECSIERSMTFISGEKLHEFVRVIPPGRTVIVNLAYEYRSLSDLDKAALEAIGSANITKGYTWAVIGKKGAPKGSVAEQSYNGENKGLGANIALRPVNRTIVSVQSRGIAKITVNSEIFSVSSENDAGLLVVIFNNTDTSEHYFNITAPSQDIELFVNLTNSLPNDTAVALVTNNAGPLHQSEELKEAIEGFGSRYISQLEDGDSWALLGHKGAAQGSVLEVASSDGPVEIFTHTLPVPSVYDNKSCRIYVESSVNDSLGGLQLSINGKISLLSGDGIWMAVVKQEGCELESNSLRLYPTLESYADLSAAIAAVPTGRIVIASIHGLAYQPDLSPSSEYRVVTKRAFESIGSYQFPSADYTHTWAWAIIGRKGAAMGSVPEAFIRGTPSSAVAVGGTMKLSKSCENELYQLECLLSLSDDW